MTAAPVRRKPFLGSCYASGNERELLLECLDSCDWSSFKGATEGWDIRECGVMTSDQADRYGPHEIRFLGGKYVRRLEAMYARSVGTRFAVSANSATSCLTMAVAALDLGPGDEVLTPCMSFNASATAVMFTNAIPVFCEVKPDTFCIDPDDMIAKITPRTKAVMVVHLGGNAADMDRIMDIARSRGLKVIEDCAQAPGVSYKGKPVGTFGDAGVFSFTETKNITCGEGGMLVCDDPRIAFKARLLRNHGEGVVEPDWTDAELANVVGMNFRLTEFQAAVMIPQLESLPQRNRDRRTNVEYLRRRLAKYDNLIHPVVEPGTDYVCFMLKWKWLPRPGQPSRDELAKALNAQGVPVGKGYGRMMHENPMFVRRIGFGVGGCPWSCVYGENQGPAYGTGTLPRSEEVNKQFLWFKFVNAPNTVEDMEDVAAAFERVLG